MTPAVRAGPSRPGDASAAGADAVAGDTVAGDAVARAVPPNIGAILARLSGAGHAAYVVGGSVRDILTGRSPVDWDVATDARPARIVELFPGASADNPFGTVSVPTENGPVEVTTFRTDRAYADFRRPTGVDFGDAIETDLARRDVTINAIAWGSRPGNPPALIDPFGGREDLAAGIIRGVGDPAERFSEDALRTLRAARFAAVLGFRIEPATLAAIAEAAPLASHLSGERIAAEIERILGADRPSIGLTIAMDTGLLRAVAPLLDDQRGVPQNKVTGEDLWDHTVRTVDATAAAGRTPVVRLAALLHDVGKPSTLDGGHFYGHEVVGAEQAADLLRRWNRPRAAIDRIVHLVRHHMFDYRPEWSDAAVRRFIAKVGRPWLDDLLALREADNVGSGRTSDADGVTELRGRIRRELAAGAAIDRSGLAIDGDEVMDALGLEPGPTVGRILDRLVEAVVADPSLNERSALVELARSFVRDEP